MRIPLIAIPAGIAVLLFAGSLTLAQPSKEEPKKEIEWKEQSIEHAGVRIKAMLPVGGNVANNEVWAGYRMEIKESKMFCAMEISTFDDDGRFPLDDPEAKFDEKEIECAKSAGVKFEHVKKVKVGDFAGLDILQKPPTVSKDEAREGVAIRRFYVKRTKVTLTVVFGGNSVPDEILQKVFASMKIETPGPLREDPEKEFPEGIVTTLGNKISFRTPGKPKAIHTSFYTFWAFPYVSQDRMTQQNYHVRFISGYFEDSLTHTGLVEFLKKSQQVSKDIELVREANCGKQLGIIFRRGESESFLAQGRAVVVDPGAVVLMLVYPTAKDSLSAEKVKKFFDSLQIDPAKPGYEVLSRDMPREFKEYTLQEAGVKVSMLRQPRAIVDKDKVLVFDAREPNDGVDKGQFILTIEPVNTTLAKQYERLRKDIPPIPENLTPEQARKLNVRDMKRLDKTYLGGRHGIIWDDPKSDSRMYFTIIGNKQLTMQAKYAGADWSEGFFKFVTLLDAKK